MCRSAEKGGQDVRSRRCPGGSAKSCFTTHVEFGEFFANPEASIAEEPAIATAAVSASSLLLMQEAKSNVRQDREARRHGEQLMEQLSALQRGLLGGDLADLERLSRLVERPIQADDPALASLLKAIQVRAAIELARRGRSTG